MFGVAAVSVRCVYLTVCVGECAVHVQMVDRTPGPPTRETAPPGAMDNEQCVCSRCVSRHSIQHRVRAREAGAIRRHPIAEV